MLLNSEELLALVNGDVEPDRLADLLDRLEHCPESSDALQVLVALRANREAALSALHDAQEREVVASVTPHPALLAQVGTVSWASQGLRLAATIAIVAVISAWASSSYLGTGQSADTSRLATTTYENIIEVSLPPDTVVTATNAIENVLTTVNSELEGGNYAEAKRILLEDPGIRSTPEGLLYLGISHYFLNEHDAAVGRLDELRGRIKGGEQVNSAVAHQAAWYLANALLALDRQVSAMEVLEEVGGARGYRFQPRAAALYAQVREAVGLTSPDDKRD